MDRDHTANLHPSDFAYRSGVDCAKRMDRLGKLGSDEAEEEGRRLARTMDDAEAFWDGYRDMVGRIDRAINR